jgi:hypothetical protein
MAETEKTPVAMEDGTTVEFTPKQKLVKTATIADGKVSVRLDFRNGVTLSYTISDDMLLRFAAHGAEQKLGDATAGEETLDDAVEAVRALIERLNAGEWAAKRERGAFSGVSTLIRALVEVSGKTVDEARAFLADKSPKEKLALRGNKKLAPVIARIEAERAKKDAIDTNALLGDFIA